MSEVNRSRITRAATFCYVWLMLGFFIGTALLLGPVRWATTFLRDGAYAQRTEDLAVLGIIATFIPASAFLARWIVRRTSVCHPRIRVAVPTALTIAAAVCLWGWMNPAHLLGAAPAEGSGRVDVAGGAEFVFGAYPDLDRLKQLKRDGFTAVISLQHPAVVPFEPIGIAEETKSAGQVGLEFIHAPMLPWVSSNDAALDQIRTIARTRTGRYYVHCGLGRDRANIVKRMLELEGTPVRADKGLLPASSLSESGMPLERGRIHSVGDRTWLLPYPNNYEFLGYLLSGQVQHITLVLDPNDADQQIWLTQARKTLEQYKVAFDEVAWRNDPTQAAEIVAATARAPKPEAIIVPFTDPSPSTAIATALMTAYRDHRTNRFSPGS